MYKGDFSNGLKNGNGTIIFVGQTQNNDIYKGQWVSDKMEGKGIYFFSSSGMIIEG